MKWQVCNAGAEGSSAARGGLSRRQRRSSRISRRRIGPTARRRRGRAQRPLLWPQAWPKRAADSDMPISGHCGSDTMLRWQRQRQQLRNSRGVPHTLVGVRGDGSAEPAGGPGFWSGERNECDQKKRACRPLAGCVLSVSEQAARCRRHPQGHMNHRPIRHIDTHPIFKSFLNRD